jgi:hypothetical protein
MIHDIQDFNAMRQRQAKNLRRFRIGAWIVIGLLFVANVVKALGVVAWLK